MKKTYIIMMITLLGLNSCKKDESIENIESQEKEIEVILNDPELISDSSVVLYARIENVEKESIQEAGFMYGASEEFLLETVKCDVLDTELRYNLNGLKNGNAYFYKSYAIINGKRYESDDMKSFSTEYNMLESPKGDVEMVFVGRGKYLYEIEFLGYYYLLKREIKQSFYISKYEVSQAEYIQFLNEAGVSSDGEYGGYKVVDIGNSDCAIGYNGTFYFKGSRYAPTADCPVNYISYAGVEAYIEWYSNKNGQEYRLVTRDEFIYASLGGKESQGYKYSGSDNLEEVAWHGSNSGDKLHPVDSKKPNELGIYNMAGNVSEFTHPMKGSDPGYEWGKTGAGGNIRIIGRCCTHDFIFCYGSLKFYKEVGFRLAYGTPNL
ncbi:MAG: formylglycine-generating enzyme family protein [Hyphomicrobiales bacterium]